MTKIREAGEWKVWIHTGMWPNRYCERKEGVNSITLLRAVNGIVKFVLVIYKCQMGTVLYISKVCEGNGGEKLWYINNGR